MKEYKKIALELQQNNPDISIVDIKNILLDQHGIEVHYKTLQKELWRAKNKKVTFEDRKESSEFDIENYYQALKNINEAIAKVDTKQTKTTLTIHDDKPIAVAFWGDWHIGARGADYEQFDKDRKLIAETDGLYLIGMGDYKDNANAYVHASSVSESIATPSMQDMLVKSFIEELEDKWLALIRGCHDDWDKKLTDKDFIASICDEVGAVNLWHGGGITIKLGEQTYKIRARHKYKNESSLNTTNAQRNMLNDFGPCDVIAIAHKHFADMQMLKRMGQKVVYFRSGSYKVYDEFGQKLAGYTAENAIPMVVIHPEQHKVVPFEVLEDGITYLKAVRK